MRSWKTRRSVKNSRPYEGSIEVHEFVCREQNPRVAGPRFQLGVVRRGASLCQLLSVALQVGDAFVVFDRFGRPAPGEFVGQLDPLACVGRGGD